MKFTIKILLVLCVINNALGQVDSLELKHLNTQKTKSEVITKYRGLILDKIVENNKIKVKEYFYDAISKYENDYYLVFFPSEKWIISLWLGDYNFILSETAITDSSSIARFKNQIKPYDDQLYFVLWQAFSKQSKEISNDINSTKSLSAVDKEFLKLIISTIIIPNNNRYQKTINSQATNFINEFPQSSYDNYVRNFIRYEYVPKGFQFGIEYFGGTTFNSGKLAKQFTNSGSFGIGFIFGYEKYHLNTRGLLIPNRIKYDIDYNGTVWENGKALSAIFEISFSYNFNLTSSTIIQPFIGLGWYTTSPTENDRSSNSELKNVDIYSKANPVFGVDINFGNYRYNYYNIFFNRQSGGYYAFNIRYQFQPVMFSSEYDYMNGQIHSIVIGVKLGIGKVKRAF